MWRILSCERVSVCLRRRASGTQACRSCCLGWYTRLKVTYPSKGMIFCQDSGRGYRLLDTVEIAVPDTPNRVQDIERCPRKGTGSSEDEGRGRTIVRSFHTSSARPVYHWTAPMSCALIFPVSAFFRYRHQLQQQLAFTATSSTTHPDSDMAGGERAGSASKPR